VCWIKKSKKWRSQLKYENTKFSEYFDNELDAAKRVNQLCEKFGLPAKNIGISEAPTKKVTKVC
jgi:hypothetical protein